MFFLIAVLALLSAAFLFARFARRQTNQITDQNTVLPLPPFGARPLFEPTDAEIRQQEEAKEARAIARRELSARAEARAAVDMAISDWRNDHSRANVARLLAVAAESGREGDFARAAKEIVKVYRESGIPGFSDSDMAALLDSHIRLVSVKEAGSGALFWLKQEVARLRSGE
jgi:hypothetical protein